MLFASAGPAMADPADEVSSLPHWALRAQQRLALEPAQQRELRLLISGNAEKIEALQRGERKFQPGDMAGLQREFREGLARILTAAQLAEWDVLLEELLGEVHLRNEPLLADNPPLQ